MRRALLIVCRWIGEAATVWLAALRQPLVEELVALRVAHDRLRDEHELLRARLLRVDSARRPQYRRFERLAILRHRERHGLSVDATAKTFVLSTATITDWLREVRDGVVTCVMARLRHHGN